MDSTLTGLRLIFSDFNQVLLEFYLVSLVLKGLIDRIVLDF